jgi:predicted MFS family arabinose efflux permease
VLRQFRDGAAYVWEHQALALAVLTILVVSTVASALVQLAPAFARDQFHVGKAGYGFLVAAYGAGAIFSSVSVAAYADRFRRSRLTMGGLATSVAGVVLLAVSPRFGVGLAALFVMGAAYITITVSLNTAIQMRVDEAYRGRVVSIYLMALMGGLPVGALLLGWVASVAGMRATMIGAGGLLAGYLVLAIVKFDGLRSIDQNLVAARDLQ